MNPILANPRLVNPRLVNPRLPLNPLLPKLALLATAVLLVISTWGQTAAQTPPDSKPAAEALNAFTKTDRFQGKAVLKSKTGRPQEVSAVLQNWALHGRIRVEKFPEHDFLVVYLHSGKVTAVIDGKPEQHKGGDFWTVPAGATMSLQVTSESALLQTLALKK
jgi:quercetin dioxygenase-like cupin family protein